MAKYFKVKTNYLKLDKSNENGTSKVSEVRLFEAVDYVDAQEQAIKKINEKGCCGECDIEIQKVSYDMCLHRPSEKEIVLKNVKNCEFDLTIEEETYWYDIRITKIIEDKDDNEKYITVKYLVEGLDLEDALDVVRKYLKDEDEEYWWFSSVQETPIQDVILSDIVIQ